MTIEYLFDDEPSYKTASSNYSADDEEFDNQSLLTEGQTLYDYLIEQIRLINIEKEDLQIAEYIIGNLIRKGLEDFHEMEFGNQNYSQDDTNENIIGEGELDTVDLMAI